MIYRGVARTNEVGSATQTISSPPLFPKHGQGTPYLRSSDPGQKKEGGGGGNIPDFPLYTMILIYPDFYWDTEYLKLFITKILDT